MSDGRHTDAADVSADFAKTPRPFCGVLVYALQIPFDTLASLVADLSDHSRAEGADFNWPVADGFRAAARELEER